MVLFDFTNYPYQVLLQAFVETERMDSYFKLFDTLVEDIELLKNKNQNLSTDLKNCIKVWSQLLEKLINSDRMLSTLYPTSTMLENQSIPFEDQLPIASIQSMFRAIDFKPINENFDIRSSIVFV